MLSSIHINSTEKLIEMYWVVLTTYHRVCVCQLSADVSRLTYLVYCRLGQRIIVLIRYNYSFAFTLFIKNDYAYNYTSSPPDSVDCDTGLAKASPRQLIKPSNY